MFLVLDKENDRVYPGTPTDAPVCSSSGRYDRRACSLLGCFANDMFWSMYWPTMPRVNSRTQQIGKVCPAALQGDKNEEVRGPCWGDHWRPDILVVHSHPMSWKLPESYIRIGESQHVVIHHFWKHWWLEGAQKLGTKEPPYSSVGPSCFGG